MMLHSRPTTTFDNNFVTSSNGNVRNLHYTDLTSFSKLLNYVDFYTVAI